MEMTREQRMTEGKKVIFAVLGTLIFSFGLNFFVVPMGLYNGGFVGIGQVIQTILFRYTSLVPGSVDIAGILYFLFNIPVFILAFHSLGRGFFVKTVICVIMSVDFFNADSKSRSTSHHRYADCLLCWWQHCRLGVSGSP